MAMPARLPQSGECLPVLGFLAKQSLFARIGRSVFRGLAGKTRIRIRAGPREDSRRRRITHQLEKGDLDSNGQHAAWRWRKLQRASRRGRARWGKLGAQSLRQRNPIAFRQPDYHRRKTIGEMQCYQAK